jgi:hypothetical protein
MFTLLLKATLAETAASIVDLRTNVDGWREGPVSDVYDPSLGGWRLTSKTGRDGEIGVAFKFFVHPSSWQGAIISSVPHGDLTTWLTRLRYRITTSRSRCRQTLGSRPQT